jgi:hypothetical protein
MNARLRSKEVLASEIEALNQAISAQAQATSEREAASDTLGSRHRRLQRQDAVIANAFRDDNEVLISF